jgi:putative Mg2+ transporter-C (MgtC) family protein
MLASIISSYYFIATVRLLLACLLGGIIGFERETANRPAGFRTYILVCVGAALVMVTSEWMFSIYHGLTTADPARLGAQIISGIGFLGAGTIMRDGMNVRGLTTAASLWAVSCVGIAAGIGFYEGAIISTILIYIVLVILKKMEKYVKKETYNTLYIEINNQQISSINQVLELHQAKIKNIEIITNEEDQYMIIKIVFKIHDSKSKLNIISDLYQLDGIKKVSEDN